MRKNSQAKKKASFPWWILGPVLLVAAVVIGLQLRKTKETPRDPSLNIALRAATQTISTAQAPPPAAANTNQEPVIHSLKSPSSAAAQSTAVADEGPIEVNTARMVTVELDFGGTMPSIAQALSQIERRYRSDDGAGRTFAILDAYGSPTNDNKLHMSMHLSMEKPGLGSLVFKRTGEVLWEGKIVPGANANEFTGKNLLILVDNGKGEGRAWTIDGASSPRSILEANVKELGKPLREVWPDGTEREFTFLYSACGCPVKARVRRAGEGTVRASDQPVMFPDDPAALEVIKTLMGWDAPAASH